MLLMTLLRVMGGKNSGEKYRFELRLQKKEEIGQEKMELDKNSNPNHLSN